MPDKDLDVGPQERMPSNQLHHAPPPGPKG